MVNDGARLTRIFNALGDPTRRGLVDLLSHEAQPVHVLAGSFPMSRPAISRHLRLLKEAGLVRESKQGRERFYSLRREALSQIREWAAGMERLSPAAPLGRSRRSVTSSKRRSPSSEPVAAASRAPKVEPAPQPAPTTKQRQPADDWQTW